jgi:Circadian oscillating protein COP23
MQTMFRPKSSIPVLVFTVSAALFVQPVNANSNISFRCGNADGGNPATLLKWGGKDYPLIIWTKAVKQYSATARCTIVSRKLEANKDVLSFLVPGKANGQSVLCVSQDSGMANPCESDRVIMTFDSDNGPQTMIELINASSEGYTVNPIKQGSCLTSRDYETNTVVISIDAAIRCLKPNTSKE